MKVAYSYIRCSTTEQIKGDTKRRQLDWSREYAAEHGWLLDESLHLQDLGISAHHGDNATKGKLGAFIKAIEEGTVKRGSVLLIENLDRLSRNEIGEALPLFLGILNAGIEIVTRTPVMHFTKASVNDVGNIIIAIIELGRAYSESAAKVQRGKDNWANKRKLAAAEKQIVTSRCPAWLELSQDGKRWIVRREAANTVRWIFKQCIAGLGSPTITRMLNEKGIPPIATKSSWNMSYVERILTSRQTIGEYQPHIVTSVVRTPVGDPIKDYYPAILDEQTFYQAQRAIKSRVRFAGRKGHRVNLFQRLLRTPDGGGYMLNDKGQGRRIVPSDARNGQTDWVTFPYDEFENTFLLWVREVQLTEKAPEQEKRDALEGRLAQLQDKIAKVKMRVASEPDVDTFLDLLSDLHQDQKAMQAQLETLKIEQHSPAQTTIDHSFKLIGRLARLTGKEREQTREQLRGIVRQLVKHIVLEIHLVSRYHRVAVAQVYFHSGEMREISVVSKGQGKRHQVIMANGNIIKNPGILHVHLHGKVQ
jgi:DNA invertase Pin-like site-specific DNA recombinase